MSVYVDKKITSDPEKRYPLIRVSDPKKKTEEYYRQNAFAIYSEYYKGLSAIPHSSSLEFAELRLFADANQPESFYKNYLSEDNYGKEEIIDPTIGYIGKKNTPSGYMRVFWDIMSPAQKIMNSIVDRCVSVSTDIVADPIDANSKEEIDDEKMDLWFEKENLEFKKQYFGELGIDTEDPEFMPETRDELELYESLGGFKPAFARAMEKLIRYTEDVSGFDVLTDMLYRDAVTLGIIAVWDEYDPETGLIKMDYVDPASSGIQWSKYPDCRDSEYAFRTKNFSISSLRQYFPDADEKFWLKVATAFQGYAGNPADVSGFAGKSQYGGWDYDFFRVPVMEARWIDNHGKQKIYTKNKFGGEAVDNVDYDFEPKKLDNKRQEFTLKRKCYQCKWIIGTEHVFDWGERTNQTYPSPKDAELGVHFYIFPGKSIIKQLVPVFHNFQVLWIRYLNALAQAINSGYEINVDSISNIQTGGDKDGGADQDLWTRRFIDTGIAFVSNINPNGIKESNQSIRELRGGMGQMFSDILLAFRFNLSLVESITGVNPIALGETPNPNAPVSTTKMALSSVSNILKYLVDGFLNVKKNAASCITRSIQVTLKHNKMAREAYRSVLGEFDMEILTDARRDSTQYAISLQARPTDAEKQIIIQQLMEAQKADRDGNTGGLTGIDAVILMRRIEAGIPMSQIQYEMETRKRKNIREIEKRKKDMMQLQSELNDKNAKVASQIKGSEAKQAHDYKMDELRQEGKNSVGKTMVQEGMKHGSAVDLANVNNGMSQSYMGSNGQEYTTDDLRGVDINSAVQAGKLKPKTNG